MSSRVDFPFPLDYWPDLCVCSLFVTTLSNEFKKKCSFFYSLNSVSGSNVNNVER